MPLCSNRWLRSAACLVLLLTGFHVRSTLAQTPSPANNPTAPEVQLPLDVDRDPVPSPDAGATPAPVPQAAPARAPGPANAPSQGGEITRKGGQFTLTRNVEEVVLNCTVVDDHQHLVMDLQKDNFKVFEDGVPQTITAFQHQDIPISLAILIDNSGSMRTKRQAVNAAAIDLVRASNPQDESVIINFADEAYQDTDLTSDINKLREGLSHIDSKGGTALYDAVVASADYLAKNATRPKQVILIITDGEDNASGTTLEETVRRIQDLQGPVVYSIGLLFDDAGGGREAHRAKRALQLLSDETGGLAFFPKNLNQVDAIAAEVARDIRNQYTIGYHSTKPPSEGGYRTVHVEAHAKGYGRLIVRTRSGYYPRSGTGARGSAKAKP